MSAQRLVFGLGIMTAGVLITLGNLGFLDAGAYLRYWPVALILIGILKLAEHGPIGRAGFAGWCWIGVGSVMLLAVLGHVRPLRLLPLLLVVIGARIVWRSWGTGSRRDRRHREASEGFVAGTALLGGSSRSSASQTFQGGDLTAFMGGCELDLRQAAIAEPPAVIDVFAMWGGIEIRVPERWLVEPEVTVLLGGIEDATGGGDRTSERLVVRGLVLMGGIEIKN